MQINELEVHAACSLNCHEHEQGVCQSVIVRGFLLALVSAVVYPLDTLATEALHSHDDIMHTARDFAVEYHQKAEKVRITLTPIDNRLRLPVCDNALEAYTPGGHNLEGHTSIGIKCHGHRPWSIRVRALIEVFDRVAVLSQSVRRGDQLSDQNIELRLLSRSRVREGVITDPASVSGYRFRKSYSSDRIVQHNMLVQPDLVSKGQKVLILSSIPGVAVRVHGIALTDGIKGSLVNVRNLSSGRIVQGVVENKGIVKVNL